MSVTELETRIVKMQEWEQLAQDAAAEAEAIRDTIKAEMLARDTEELTAGRFIVRWRSVFLPVKRAVSFISCMSLLTESLRSLEKHGHRKNLRISSKFRRE